MAVLIPNADLTARVRRRPSLRDAHGQIVPSPFVAFRGPWPCGVKDRPDTGGWSLRLDPRMWPLEAGDEVTDGVRVWVLTGEPQLHTVPGVDAVDYIQARGTLNPPEPR